MKWTDDKVETLKRLRAQGHSATEIGMTLRCTRSAVIGKAARLGLCGGKAAAVKSGQETAIRRRVTSRGIALTPAPMKSNEVRPLPSLRAVPAPERPVSLMELRAFHCRYPTEGEGADTLFCGRRKDGDRPYCTECARVAFKPFAAKEPKNANQLAMALRRYAA